MHCTRSTAYWSHTTNQVAFINDMKNDVSIFYDFANASVCYFNGYYADYSCDLAGTSTNDPDSLGDSLAQYDYVHKATYSHDQMTEAGPSHIYAFSENVVIVKAYHEIGALAKDNKTPTYQHHAFYPFGQWAGNFTIQMLDFEAGPQPMDKVKASIPAPGFDGCPLDYDKCQAQAKHFAFTFQGMRYQIDTSRKNFLEVPVKNR